jgi:hypothetical protein
MPTPPSLAEFSATVRDAFSFLDRFGFNEIPVPAHRTSNPFQIWFSANGRFVVVAGEGYGTMASVTLEHDGRELADVYLVPSEFRARRKPGRRPALTQLEQISEAAQRLERHGADFLAGDFSRFDAMAKPLPPYKKRADEPQAG